MAVPHIFVSYARRDNEAAEGEPFVSRLVRYIEVEGPKMGGREIKVFHEGVIESGTEWEQAIYDELETCQIFLPIVSPSWATSDWTGRQWDAVAKRVEKDQNLGKKTRIIPVAYLLDKGSNAMLPARVKSLLLKHYFPGVMEDLDFRKLAELVVKEIVSRLNILTTDADVSETSLAIPALRDNGGVRDQAMVADRRLDGFSATARDANSSKEPVVGQQLSFHGPNKARVFLGFAFSGETKRARDRIRGELSDRGYETRHVEEIDFSWRAEQLISAIESQAAGCSASVHFLEESAGPTFDGDPRPIVQIQCDLARLWASTCANLFWTGQVPAETLRKYPTFIRMLKYNNDPIAAFTRSVLDVLRGQENATEISPTQPVSVEPIIWIICERGDLEIAREIVNYFRDMGWVAFVPGLNAPEKPYSLIFREENYFLFYWGKGAEDWCLLNYQKLVDARREGNGFKPPLAALVYNGQLKLDYKEKFEWAFLKAPEYDRFNPKSPKLREFVSKVQSSSSVIYPEGRAS
jgi:hypothetical protein